VQRYSSTIIGIIIGVVSFIVISILMILYIWSCCCAYCRKSNSQSGDVAQQEPSYQQTEETIAQSYSVQTSYEHLLHQNIFEHFPHERSFYVQDPYESFSQVIYQPEVPTQKE
jgi:ABC-type antimicrobial peptide transport system permease subunit